EKWEGACAHIELAHSMVLSASQLNGDMFKVRTKVTITHKMCDSIAM
ncbi:MAG: hypothetical protein ACJATG_002350, partial [Dinoroseobacter sp.]